MIERKPCPYCGYMNTLERRHCKNCQANLRDEEESSPSILDAESQGGYTTSTKVVLGGGLLIIIFCCCLSIFSLGDTPEPVSNSQPQSTSANGNNDLIEPISTKVAETDVNTPSTKIEKPTPAEQPSLTLTNLPTLPSPTSIPPTVTSTSQPQPSNTPQPTATETGDKIENYTFITTFNPGDDPNAFGADVLLLDDINNFEVEDIVIFIKDLSDPYEVAVIRLWTSQTAYDQDQNYAWGPEYSEGYILYFAKTSSTTSPEIRWFQEVGKFSSLFGTRTPIND